MTDEHNPPSGPVDATNRRFFKLLEDSGPLFAVWCVLSFFALGYVMLAGGIEMRTGAPYMHEIMASDNPLDLLASRRVNYASYLLYPVMVVLFGLHYASVKVIVEFDRRGDEVDPGEARRLISDRFGMTALVAFIYMVLCGLGGVCCVLPGLAAAYLLMFAPYLISSQQMSVARALTTSSDWAKRHWILALVMVGIGLVLSLAIAAVQYVAVSAFASMMGPTGIVVGHVVSWVFFSVAGYFVWLYTGAIYSTIQRFESQF